jgi:hypothetical protein
MKVLSDIPEDDAGEAGMTALRVVLAGVGLAIPGAAIGGELLLGVLGSSVRRRQTEFLREVAERVNYLLENGLTIEDLSSNERFVTTTLKATQAAMRTHEKSKRDALRNAVTNVARGQSIDETLQHIFLELVDRYSETHLRVLHAMQKPVRLSDARPISVRHSIFRSVPHLKESHALTALIWNDLHSAGLVEAASLEYTMQDTGGGSLKQTTHLGDEFLRFIAEG